MYLLAPFYCAKFQKILKMDPELWGHTIFRPKMAHFLQIRTFSEKTVNKISTSLLTPFIVENSKKNP